AADSPAADPGRVAATGPSRSEISLAPGGRAPDQPCPAAAPGISDRSGGRPERGRSRTGRGPGLPRRAPRPAGAAHGNRAGGGAGRGPAAVGRLLSTGSDLLRVG